MKVVVISIAREKVLTPVFPADVRSQDCLFSQVELVQTPPYKKSFLFLFHLLSAISEARSACTHVMCPLISLYANNVSPDRQTQSHKIIKS